MINAVTINTLSQSSKRLLSDDLPLRLTTAWGNYETTSAIPLVYGQCVLSPVQYSQDRTLWCMADHAITSVERVRRDGQDSFAYAWRNEVDTTGKTVAVLELSDALADGERIEVKLTGKPLTNPADIMADLLNGVTGWGGSAKLSRFKSECQRLGIAIGGAFTEIISIRSAIKEICTSIGASWSGGVRDLALFFPSPTEVTPVATLTDADLVEPSADTRHDDLFTVLEVQYNHDYSANKSLRSLTVECKNAISLYGENQSTLSAKWLRSAKDAQSLAERLLTRLAQPQWTIQTGINWRFRSLKVGDYVQINSVLIPSGIGIIASIESDYDSASISATIKLNSERALQVSARRLSESWEPVQLQRFPIDYANGVLTLTVLDDYGEPMAMAEVTLDGVQTAMTNAQGKVQFSASRGKHTLYVESVGYVPMSAEIAI